MPRMDRMGPEGMGSKTGRGLGHCTGEGRNAGAGMGFGRNRGSGGFCRRGSGGLGWQAMDPAQDKGWLARQVEALEARLAVLKQRLSADVSEGK